MNFTGILTNNKPTGVVDYFQASKFTSAHVRELLNSSNLQLKYEGLSRILAAASIGQDVTSVFADVLKQLFVREPLIKRLAHICLAMFADKFPDMALLCVNALQKDIVDADPIVRGLAVRTICSISIREVSEHILATLQKSSCDSSVYVRKCSALAVGICWSKDIHGGLNLETVTPILERLLSDYEPVVISALMVSCSTIFAENIPMLNLLHRHFNRLVTILWSLEHCAQLSAVDVLYRYCLQNFSVNSVDEDLRAFLKKVEQFVLYTPSAEVFQLGLVVLCDLGGRDSQMLPPSIANRIEVLVHHHMSKLGFEGVAPFLQFFSHNANLVKRRCNLFFINSVDDSLKVKVMKLKILTGMINAKNAKPIFAEIAKCFKACCGNKELLSACVEGLCRVGCEFPDLAPHVVQLLIEGLTTCDNSSLEKRAMRDHLDPSNLVVLSMVQVLRRMEMHSPLFMNALDSIVACIGNGITSTAAKLSIITLLQIFGQEAKNIITKALHLFAKGIEKDGPVVKLQLAILALDYDRNIQSNSRKSLQPVTDYIVNVACRDKEIGEVALCIKDSLSVNELLKLLVSGACTENTFVNEDEGIKVVTNITQESDSLSRLYRMVSSNKGALPIRPSTDSDAGLRKPSLFDHPTKIGATTSLSSEQAVLNRTSQNVLVPTSHSKLPKVITTLEDLDLFFADGV